MVARLWSRLQGAAKSVVKHLDPDQSESESGLQAFLQVLRSSPLQQLPISDSFNRLEKWNHLRRGEKETITELIVREEVLFTELQQALVRARRDRSAELPTVREEHPEEPDDQPPSTPSRSPTGAFRRRTATRVDGESIRVPTTSQHVAGDDFFSDEMRGYSLLKACRLSGNERQNVLVQTSNTTPSSKFVELFAHYLQMTKHIDDPVIGIRARSGGPTIGPTNGTKLDGTLQNGLQAQHTALTMMLTGPTGNGVVESGMMMTGTGRNRTLSGTRRPLSQMKEPMVQKKLP